MKKVKQVLMTLALIAGSVAKANIYECQSNDGLTALNVNENESGNVIVHLQSPDQKLVYFGKLIEDKDVWFSDWMKVFKFFNSEDSLTINYSSERCTRVTCTEEKTSAKLNLNGEVTNFKCNKAVH